METADGAIATRYERLAKERRTQPASAWTVAERVIWNVVTARCQKDMGGIETVFTDSALDTAELVGNLELLDEPELASAWATAIAVLTEQGYLVAGRWSGADGSPHEHVFRALDEAVGDRMWDLDGRLFALLR